MHTRRWLWAATVAGCIGLAGCRSGGLGLIEALFGPDLSTSPVDIQPPEAKGLAMLDWIVGIGFLLAAVGAVLSFVASSIPVLGKIGAGPLRAFAAACLGCALASLVLKVLIVKYLWIVVPAILVCAVIAAALYVYGHRKWIERQTGVDVTPWDGKGPGK